jgi:HAD superfamily hydrolase (TIGR01509 family)
MALEHGPHAANNMIKAIIFDMDGVLIDSEPFWQESAVQAFSSVGLPMTYQKVTETMGMRVDETVEYWHNKYPWKQTTKKEVEADIVKGVIHLVKKHGAPKQGIIDFIKRLEQMNTPMAIASSSYMEVIDAIVDKLNIRTYINVIHSAEHEPYGKPHPAVFLTTAEKLEVKPSECLVFEDSPNGVLAAKAAQMKCIALPDQGVKGDKRFFIADMILSSIQDFHMELLQTL